MNMKIVDTISVNPGKSTLGHSENSQNIFRTTVLNKERNTSKVSLYSIVLPSEGYGMYEMKKYLLPFRTLFATILIISGLTLIQTTIYSIGIVIGNVELISAIFLALGFLSRPIMLLTAIFLGISSAVSLRNGVTDITTLSLMFGCLIFAAIGSGKYSLDCITRRAIIRHIKKSKIKKNSETLGYKAFHYAEF